MKKIISFFILIRYLISFNTTLWFDNNISKKRNIQRILDMKSLEKSIYSYYEKNKTFIISKAGWEDLINHYNELKEFIDLKTFQDPLGDYYKYGSDWKTFQIRATLEKSSSNTEATVYLLWNCNIDETKFYYKNWKAFYKGETSIKQSEFWFIKNYKNSKFNKEVNTNQEINGVVIKNSFYLPYEIKENILICTLFGDNINNDTFSKNKTCKNSIDKLTNLKVKFYKKVLKDRNDKKHTQLFVEIYWKK